MLGAQVIKVLDYFNKNENKRMNDSLRQKSLDHMLKTVNSDMSDLNRQNSKTVLHVRNDKSPNLEFQTNDHTQIKKSQKRYTTPKQRQSPANLQKKHGSSDFRTPIIYTDPTDESREYLMGNQFQSISHAHANQLNLTFHSPKAALKQTIYDPNLYGHQINPQMYKTARASGSIWIDNSNSRLQQSPSGTFYQQKLKVSSILPTAQIGDKLPELMPASTSQQQNKL